MVLKLGAPREQVLALQHAQARAGERHIRKTASCQQFNMVLQRTAGVSTAPLIGATDSVPGSPPPIGALGSPPPRMLLHSSSGSFYSPCGAGPAFTAVPGVPTGTMIDGSHSRRHSIDSIRSAGPQDARSSPSETGTRSEEPVNVNALKRHITSLRDQVHNWRDRALKAESAAQKALEVFPCCFNPLSCKAGRPRSRGTLTGLQAKCSFVSSAEPPVNVYFSSGRF